jgi:hypothetical protein
LKWLKREKGDPKVDIAQLAEVETKEGVKFALEPGGGLSVEGEDAAIERVLAHVDRNEVAKLVRERDGSPEPIVKRVLALNVLSKATYRANYITWYSGKSDYYKPSEAELDKMFSMIEEGDEVCFDFAHSVTVRKPNGLLVAVDRRGRVSPPSPYTPHAAKVK